MDRIDRRGFLDCMAWAGTGLLWVSTGGLVSSRLISSAEAADASAGSFTFAQISDTHIGFKGQANGDPVATLQQVVDRVNALESVQVDIVMMRTPDGHGRLELTKFRNPKLVEVEPAIAPPNTLGLRSVMFTVESVDDTVARLRADGAELVGEVAQYEDKYRLCYMRGPAGIIVALAEELF